MANSTLDQVARWREATFASTALAEIWTRYCPACKERLQKAWPLDPWACACGWQCPWGVPDNSSRRATRGWYTFLATCSGQGEWSERWGGHRRQSSARKGRHRTCLVSKLQDE